MSTTKKSKYKVISHNPYSHNILFDDSMMATESFMVIGSTGVAHSVCNVLNHALIESRKPEPPIAPKKVRIPSVDEVVDSCKFRPMSTPRYMIEQTIFYCARVFGIKQEEA
jgi:hypothetical protein